MKLLEEVFWRPLLEVGTRFSIHHVHTYNPEVFSSSKMIFDVITQKNACIAMCLCQAGASSEKWLGLK